MNLQRQNLSLLHQSFPSKAWLEFSLQHRYSWDAPQGCWQERGGISPTSLSGQEHFWKPFLEAGLCCGKGKLITNF